MVKTKKMVSTHKPLNLNCSAMPKSLMCGGKDVFEYSVFGSPQQKIGDFAQTKMGDFNA